MNLGRHYNFYSWNNTPGLIYNGWPVWTNSSDLGGIPTSQIRHCPTPKYRVILTFSGIKDTAQITRRLGVTEQWYLWKSFYCYTAKNIQIRQFCPEIAKWDAKSYTCSSKFSTVYFKSPCPEAKIARHML